MKTTVNQRVKILRETLNLQLAKFAAGCGMSLAAIMRIEDEENIPRESTLIKICRTYNVNKAWLFEGKGEIFSSGSAQENAAIAESSKHLQPENPWKDAMILEMKEEITYLRDLLKVSIGKGTNFRPAPEYAGNGWLYKRPLHSGVAAQI